MNLYFPAWQRLDRHLLQFYPEAWLLKIHYMYVGAIVFVGVLAFVVLLFPGPLFAVSVYALQFILGSAIAYAALLWVPVAGGRVGQVLPLAREGRWPHLLSRWHCMMVFSLPLLLLPLLAQVRTHQLAGSYDAMVLPEVESVCPMDPLYSGEQLGECCAAALSRFAGLPKEQLSHNVFGDALELSYLLNPGWGDRTGLGQPEDDAPVLVRFFVSGVVRMFNEMYWLDVLLLGLLMACMSQCFDFVDLRGSRLEALGHAPVYFSVMLFAPPVLGFLFYFVEPPKGPAAWLVLATVVAIVGFSLLNVIGYSGRRRALLVWCWAVVLLGLPLLVIWAPLLFSTQSARMLCQFILLGFFLALTPWLQRLHDRVRALPA